MKGVGGGPTWDPMFDSCKLYGFYFLYRNVYNDHMAVHLKNAKKNWS
jgi:hypothetical protein